MAADAAGAVSAYTEESMNRRNNSEYGRYKYQNMDDTDIRI